MDSATRDQHQVKGTIKFYKELKIIFFLGYAKSDLERIPKIEIVAITLEDINSIEGVYNELNKSHEVFGAFKVWKLSFLSK